MSIILFQVFAIVLRCCQANIAYTSEIDIADLKYDVPQLHELHYRFMVCCCVLLRDIICLVREYAFVTELPNYQTKCGMLMVRSDVKCVIFL